MLSLFGTTDGKLTYQLNRYKDGSGDYTTIIPCRTYQEAVAVVKNLALQKIENKRLSVEEFELCLEIGVKFSNSETKFFANYRNEAITKRYSNARDKFLELEQNIAKEQSELNKILGGKNE